LRNFGLVGMWSERSGFASGSWFGALKGEEAFATAKKIRQGK